MGERFKLIRKTLGMSQGDFGARLGVSNTAISKLEKGENNLTEQMIKLVCREFNVSYFWLVNGEGQMFNSIPESLVDELAQKFNLDDTDKEIILGYLRLSEDERKVFKKYVAGLTGR